MESDVPSYPWSMPFLAARASLRWWCHWNLTDLNLRSAQLILHLLWLSPTSFESWSPTRRTKIWCQLGPGCGDLLWTVDLRSSKSVSSRMIVICSGDCIHLAHFLNKSSWKHRFTKTCGICQFKPLSLCWWSVLVIYARYIDGLWWMLTTVNTRLGHEPRYAAHWHGRAQQSHNTSSGHPDMVKHNVHLPHWMHLPTRDRAMKLG